jgi:hypothetical protein
MFFKLLGGLVSKLLSALLSIAAFIIEHWRIFLPLAIVVAGLWRINVVTAQRDDARAQYANHIAADKSAAELRRQENTAKYMKASAQQAISNYQHQSEVNILKGKYEERVRANSVASATSINDWRERVRLEVARNATYGMPGDSSDSSGSAEGKRDGDTAITRQAYENLELACAITTADYNSLRRWADNTCRIYTCK